MCVCVCACGVHMCRKGRDGEQVGVSDVFHFILLGLFPGDAILEVNGEGGQMCTSREGGCRHHQNPTPQQGAREVRALYNYIVSLPSCVHSEATSSETTCHGSGVLQ